MKNKLKILGIMAPVYVTRPTADGYIASYSLALYQSLLALLIIWLNVLLWGVIGIIQAIRVLY